MDSYLDKRDPAKAYEAKQEAMEKQPKSEFRKEIDAEHGPDVAKKAEQDLGSTALGEIGKDLGFGPLTANEADALHSVPGWSDRHSEPTDDEPSNESEEDYPEQSEWSEIN